MNKILIIGGGGYVGTVLCNLLLKEGYEITVYDLFIFGYNTINDHKNLTKIKGDVRNISLIEPIIKNHEIIIHLACISNDPSFELNPELGKSINFDYFEDLVKISKILKIKKFIYASSSSVYGLKKEKNVNEEMSLEPLTDYSRFKADCEKILKEYKSENFITTIIPE